MKLGIGAAALLALGGGAVALVEPGLRGGHLTDAGRLVFSRAGVAMLDGVLPAEAAQRQAAADAFLVRVDVVVAALAPNAQQELSQLLALLATAAGRRSIAGLPASWQAASLAQVQAALEGMRTSSLSLRVQAYQALHDISAAAYFADAATWPVLGYPGPVAL